MNGEAIAILLTVVVGVAGLMAMSSRHGTRLGKIEQSLKTLLGVKTHVDQVEHRLTALETKHDCCPQCTHDGGG